ncbi:hypothetical protein [Streptomyces sp. NBC_00829]|uniref:hypothetical protein n=1 Tax=Streptomyces sp. NBC_00829 TaxID=2903679 RepID=UPI003869CF57|nr:hypothetical protein OG293_40435 [Streptomyces sp. NBC_00829]
MHQFPMLFRFIASGATPESAFATYAAKDRELPVDPFSPRADLTTVNRVTAVRERAALHAVAAGYFNASILLPSSPSDGEPLNEDDAEWLADRLIEDDAPCVRSGGAGALLLDAAGPEPSWLFIGWSTRAE